MDNSNQDVKYWKTKKDLLEALKEKGLPSTWAQIKLYEVVKLIPSPRNIVLFHRKDSPTNKGNRIGSVISKRDMPIFTQEDIDELVMTVAKIKADEETKKQQENLN